jgi:chromosome segregation ATPase
MGIADLNAAIANNPDLQKYISGEISGNRLIDISALMTELSQVGKLTQLAYCGSKGFPCSVVVIQILSNYQSLIKNSSITCHVFTQTSMEALKSYRTALIFADKGLVTKAVGLISSTADLAGKMAERSGKLVDEAQALCDKAEQGLIAAHRDDVDSTAKVNQVKKELQELQAKQAELNSRRVALAERVKKAEKDEEVILTEAREARQRAFVVNIISAFIAPLTQVGSAIGGIASVLVGKPKDIKSELENTLKEMLALKIKAETEREVLVRQMNNKKDELKAKQAALSELPPESTKKDDLNKSIAGLQSQVSTLEQQLNAKEKDLIDLKEPLAKVTHLLESQVKNCEARATDISKERAQLQDRLIEANANLAETVQKLANSTAVEKNLTQSIQSLWVVVHSLGKIKTVFENTRKFWIGIAERCQNLADINRLKEQGAVAEIDEELKVEFIDGIKYAGLSWITLFKMIDTAATAMNQVDGEVDTIMTNLPDSKRALQMVKDISATMLAQIEEERATLIAEQVTPALTTSSTSTATTLSNSSMSPQKKA